MSSLSDRFVDWILKHPWQPFLLALALFVAGVPGLARLQADFTYRAFFEEDDPILQKFERFERRFGNDDAAVLAVYSPSGIFDEDSIRLLHELTDALWQVTEVIRVDSLTNYNWVHAEGDDLIVEPFIDPWAELTPELIAQRKQIALHHEVLPDYLINRDGDLAVLYAAIRPSFEASPKDREISEEIQQLLDRFRGRGDHQFYYTGTPAIGYTMQVAALHDVERLFPLVGVLTVLMLWLLLRRIKGVVMPFSVIFYAIPLAMGISGYLGMLVSNITTMLPQMLLAIAIADSVHLLVTYFRNYDEQGDRLVALRYSLKKNLLPTLLTSLTTSAGFFSFATANLVGIANLGFLGGIGTLLAWVATYFIFAPLIRWWPLPAPKQLRDPDDADVAPFHHRFAEGIQRNRVAVMAVFAIVFAGSAWMSSRLEVNADPYKYFAPGTPLRTANDFIEAHLGGTRGVEVVVEAGAEEGIKDPAFLRRVEQLQDWINRIPGVTKTVSLIDILKLTNKSLHGDDPQWYRLPDDRETVGQLLFLYQMSLPQGMDINDRVTTRNDALRLSVLWTINDSATTLKKAAEIEQKATSLGLTVETTGKTMLWQSMNPYVVSSFLQSIVLAIVSISLILLVYFRSVSLGLLALLPNIVPLAFGGAFLYLIGRPLDAGTILVYSVCLGIAVDNTIHTLANYRRELDHGHAPADAMARVIGHTGPALVVTTLILVASFGVLAFAEFMPNRFFGILTAIVLTVALITDLLLLPAIVMKRRTGEEAR